MACVLLMAVLMKSLWVSLVVLAGCLGPVEELPLSQPANQDAGYVALDAGHDAGVVDAGTPKDAGVAQTSFAVAHPDCAPWDGPALRIDVFAAAATCNSEQQQPRFSFHLNRVGLQPLLPQTLVLGVDINGVGQVTRCTSVCETGTGTLIIERASETEVEASYDVTIGGQRFQGHFVAPRCMEPTFCG